MICPFCNFEHTVAVPVVHTNGTAAVDLLKPLDAAVQAIAEADRALLNTHPNGRDYYLTDNVQRAIGEHCRRREELLAVAKGLVEMRDHVAAVMECGRRQA